MITVLVTMPPITVLIASPSIDGFWQMIGRAHAAPWQVTAAPRTAWQPVAVPGRKE